jgi:hypothetical protein
MFLAGYLRLFKIGVHLEPKRRKFEFSVAPFPLSSLIEIKIK